MVFGGGGGGGGGGMVGRGEAGLERVCGQNGNVESREADD